MFLNYLFYIMGSFFLQCKIQYPLIGDPTWTLSKNFQVLIESDGLADRGTFVIDPEGKIQFQILFETVLLRVRKNRVDQLLRLRSRQRWVVEGLEVPVNPNLRR